MRTRTPAARAAITVAALAVAVVLFVLLAGGDDEGTGSAAQHPQSTHAESPQRATGDPSPPRQQRPTIERIVVRGGNPVGGVRRLEYESGERIRFSVRSDTADEVHVHGFDITKDVPAKGIVRFGFAAKLEGVFAVELHHSETEIAELRIKP
jgi:hypothetical protein